ncbi:MAG TPA: dienelactone hydrolase family protein [Thermoanaerobaculia bacterium]|nr:dienelactone hydrolase family protein [Thermoanaerobaculia bacterium]
MTGIHRKTDLSLNYLETTPGGGDASAELPLVIGLHGRGSNAQDLAAIAGALDMRHHYRFIFPDAPRPFEPYPGKIWGFSWFDSWPPRKESLTKSRASLLALIGELQLRYPTTPGRVALIGFSQGGLMSLDVGFRTKEPLAAIVCMSGAIHEEELPDLKARRDQKVMIVHGTADNMIPVKAARRTRLVLQEHGIDPVYEEFDMGHFVIEESMEAVANFLGDALG